MISQTSWTQPRIVAFLLHLLINWLLLSSSQRKWKLKTIRRNLSSLLTTTWGDKRSCLIWFGRKSKMQNRNGKGFSNKKHCCSRNTSQTLRSILTGAIQVSSRGSTQSFRMTSCKRFNASTPFLKLIANFAFWASLQYPSCPLFFKKQRRSRLKRLMNKLKPSSCSGS